MKIQKILLFTTLLAISSMTLPGTGTITMATPAQKLAWAKLDQAYPGGSPTGVPTSTMWGLEKAEPVMKTMQQPDAMAENAHMVLLQKISDLQAQLNNLTQTVNAIAFKTGAKKILPESYDTTRAIAD